MRPIRAIACLERFVNGSSDLDPVERPESPYTHPLPRMWIHVDNWQSCAARTSSAVTWASRFAQRGVKLQFWATASSACATAEMMSFAAYHPPAMFICGSIGPRSLAGPKRISSAPKARRVAALLAMSGMTNTSLLQRLCRTRIARRACSPLPPGDRKSTWSSRSPFAPCRCSSRFRAKSMSIVSMAARSRAPVCVS